MKRITREMMSVFKIKKIGYDFMGYTFKRENDLTFHHLIIPFKECKKCGLGDGCLFWNGAILNQSTSHDYLHVIERVDPEIFYQISSEMIDENNLRKIELANLKKIRELLLYFEREHDRDRNSKGALLIKEEFLSNRIEL